VRVVLDILEFASAQVEIKRRLASARPHRPQLQRDAHTIGAQSSFVQRLIAVAGVKNLLLSHVRIHMDKPNRHVTALDNLRKTFFGKAGTAEVQIETLVS
jgi:hypothetical protein